MAEENPLSDPLTKSSYPSVADQIYGDIRVLLSTGEIPPGRKVTLRGLAERTGTSQMPIRDAVRRLVAEGGLQKLPTRGLRVPKPTLEEFREIVKIRVNLEGLATEEAARRIGKAHIATIARMARHYEKLANREKLDVKAVVLANQKLHFHLYNIAEMPFLIGLVQNLWVRIAPIFSVSMRLTSSECNAWKSIIHHRSLVEALAAGDVAAARAAIVNDILDAAKFVEFITYQSDNSEPEPDQEA